MLGTILPIHNYNSAISVIIMIHDMCSFNIFSRTSKVCLRCNCQW